MKSHLELLKEASSKSQWGKHLHRTARRLTRRGADEATASRKAVQDCLYETECKMKEMDED
jgi:hypothetical protein